MKMPTKPTAKIKDGAPCIVLAIAGSEATLSLTDARCLADRLMAAWRGIEKAKRDAKKPPKPPFDYQKHCGIQDRLRVQRTARLKRDRERRKAEKAGRR